jgi:hypothetical protein
MASRRRRKEEEEELQRQKKALKKSFQKDFSGKKRVGSSRLSDTKKFIIMGSVAIVIILIVTIQFINPPKPVCYFTEVDFIYANLDQDAENITFNRILAWYYLKPVHTQLSCDVRDFFDTSFGYDIVVKPDSIEDSIDDVVGDIVFRFNEESSAFSFSTFMENGTPLQISTWVNLSAIELTPSSISKGVPTVVNFKLDIVSSTAVDLCNISLAFNKNLENTTIEFSSISNGTADSDELTFYTSKEDIPANTHILLDFNLSITTSSTLSERNLLSNGEIHLVLENKLLSSFNPYTQFKESGVDFSAFLYKTEPSVEKTKLLDVVINVPFYNITINP